MFTMSDQSEFFLLVLYQFPTWHKKFQSSTIITLDTMSRQKSLFCELVQTGGGGWINGNEVSSITKKDRAMIDH